MSQLCQILEVQTKLLIYNIRISAYRSKLDEASRLGQEELDIKCLQLLRAIIHNEVVRLPAKWEDNPQKYIPYVYTMRI